MSDIVVSSGQTVSGLLIAGGTEVTVTSGGTLLDATVTVGGTLNDLGGTLNGTLVDGTEATLTLGAGGVAVGTTLTGGGYAFVSSGGILSDTLVSGVSSDEDFFPSDLDVGFGGTSVSSFVLSGGQEFIGGGGLASLTSVGSGGFLDVAIGGSASGTVFDGGAADIPEFVSSGETVSGLVIGGYQTLDVLSGGTVIDAEINDFGVIFLDPGATASETTLIGNDLPSGTQFIVSSGAAAIDTFIGSGKEAAFYSGSTGLFITVSSGGWLYAAPGTDISGLTVNSSATAFLTTVVSSGEILSGFIVSANRTLVILSGGSAVDTTVAFGGTLTISGGGFASHTTTLPPASDVLMEGAVIQVSGGTAIDTTLAPAAQQIVLGGGSAIGSVIGIGGYEAISAGGWATDTVVSSGGSLHVSLGGMASGTVVESGGTVFTDLAVSSGQTVSGLDIGPYDTLQVELGGTALGTRVDGGYLTVLGGLVTGTIVTDAPTGLSGGVFVGGMAVEGGSALETMIVGNADMSIDDGLASGIVIQGTPDAPVELQVGSAGTAISAIVGSGGYAYVYSAGTALDTVVSGGTLTVAEGGVVSGTTSAGDGTLAGIPCFAAGTLILTETGLVPVEQLRVGDLIPAEDGVVEPVAWIGSRVVDCRRHPHPEQVRPVCIRAHAFGINLPRRDLFLSPDHAIFADGVLIPIRHLINGGNIRQVDWDRVTYVHVELPRHAVILAEGLPAESYLDTGDRTSFVDAVTALTLHPAFGSELRDVSLIFEAKGYAPLRVTGPEVERVRARLASADSQQTRAVIPQPGGGGAPRRA